MFLSASIGPHNNTAYLAVCDTGHNQLTRSIKNSHLPQLTPLAIDTYIFSFYLRSGIYICTHFGHLLRPLPNIRIATMSIRLTDLYIIFVKMVIHLYIIIFILKFPSVCIYMHCISPYQFLLM